MAPSPPSVPPSTVTANGCNTHEKDDNWGCTGIQVTPQAMLMGYFFLL